MGTDQKRSTSRCSFKVGGKGTIKLIQGQGHSWGQGVTPTVYAYQWNSPPTVQAGSDPNAPKIDTRTGEAEPVRPKLAEPDAIGRGRGNGGIVGLKPAANSSHGSDVVPLSVRPILRTDDVAPTSAHLVAEDTGVSDMNALQASVVEVKRDAACLQSES